MITDFVIRFPWLNFLAVMLRNLFQRLCKVEKKKKVSSNFRQKSKRVLWQKNIALRKQTLPLSVAAFHHVPPPCFPCFSRLRNDCLGTHLGRRSSSHRDGDGNVLTTRSDLKVACGRKLTASHPFDLSHALLIWECIELISLSGGGTLVSR